MNEQASTAEGTAAGSAAGPGAGAITVEIVARPPHTSFLVVTYDGLEPPRDLFADLEMIGWAPPVLAPPPRSAIDWSTPNEATGETFTVRSWKVEGAIVEPPAGSGPRGSWNPHEGDAFLRAMHGVLQRHGVQPLEADGRMRNAPPPPVTASAPPPPAAPPATGKKRSGLRGLSSKLRDAADGVGSPSRSAASAKAATADASVELLSLVLTIPEDGKLAIRGTAAPARFPAIEDGLLALGVDVWFATEEHEEKQTFRGSSVSTTVMKFKITALAEPGVAADAVTVFDEHGAKVDVEVLDAEQALAVARAADAESGRADEEQVDEELAMVQLRYPCVHLVVEPMRTDDVIGLIHRLGLQFARKHPTELESVGVFRGSKHVTRKPAMAFDVWAPPAHAARVLEQLAVVGGVDPERQPDQAWIEPPPPARPDAADEADGAAGATPSGIPSVEIAGLSAPKARREIASETDVEPLDIERDLAGLIDQAHRPDVTQRSGSGDEVLTHR
jgi:hypothetical protein